MSINTTIEPRVAVGPFKLGMTRDEAWSRTRGVITSFFPQTWSTERTDDFREFAISADYEGGLIVRLVAFTSYRPYVNRSVLSLFDQELGPESGRDDVLALLEQQKLPYLEGRERIDVPDLGLTFGFDEQGENDDERLGWISVEVAGRERPFTKNTVIVPRVGAGPFKFGMTRDEARSHPQSLIWSTERTDDLRELAICAEYEVGLIVRLVVFTSYRPYVNRSMLSLFDHVLGPEADRGDVVALLEQQKLSYVEGRERIDVPDLGLTFGFVEHGENDDERLGWISVEVAGRKEPFTKGSADASE